MFFVEIELYVSSDDFNKTQQIILNNNTLSNFLQRTITGAIFIILIIGSILWNHYAFSLVFLIFTILGVTEFYSIISKTGSKPYGFSGIIISALLFLICSYIAISNSNIHFILIILPLLFIDFIIELFRNHKTPIQNIAFTYIGIFYVALPMSLLNFLSNPGFEHDKYSKGILLGFFLLIWSNDTFAYLIGRKFGKHKLFERISPKKTWEGSIGGLIFSLITSYILSVFVKDLSIFQWLGMSIIVVIFGTLGDLTESMLKRSLDIKDSGNILPGHGGILDRFDAVLLAAPFAFIYLFLVL